MGTSATRRVGEFQRGNTSGALRDFGPTWPEVWTIDEGFIYALSAAETGLSFAASSAANSRPLSCRFKRPCPPRRQRHFRGNADRAYNTLHFASQSRVPKGAPLESPTTKQAVYSLCGSIQPFCCQQPISRSVCVLVHSSEAFLH